MSTTNYKDTLNLPKTEFPMAAKLLQREPEIRKRWEDMKIYEKIVAARKGKPKWILHDGPPYANGDVHVGTGQNKILKDMVVKFRTMQGYYSPYVPGWDCHGLPIEHKVLKDLGSKAKGMSKAEVRELCQKFAEKYIDIQRNQFKSLGVFGDWDNPYLTIQPNYEVSIIEVFEEMWKKGHVFKGLKSVHWCMKDRTALAEAEIEYRDEPSPSIYLTFEGIDGPDMFAWTTTPWTLPANVAVAVHPEVEYSLVEYEHPVKGKRKGVCARALRDQLADFYKITNKLENIPGRDLEGKKYRQPLNGKECPVVLAEYVTVTDGTGLVHTAPGHGAEDFETGVKYKLPIVCPVDKAGKMTEEAGPYQGLKVWDANPKIIEDLKKVGTIVHSNEITHRYAVCWRCKQPIIFRATEQWFVNVDKNDGRKRAIEAAKEANWIPDWGETRITSMLELRPDWCISRQRSWGVPIPAFYCAKCEEPMLNEQTLDATKKLFTEKGANGWFTTETKDFLPKDLKCKCGASDFIKEEDIFDVWFESAASHRAVCMKHPELQFPAELYLEGTDQHRGWFQVSLLASLFSNGQAPFKTVVTHGFIIDGRTGNKVSKSEGGKPGFLYSADDVSSKLGVELFRLWISSIDFTGDLPMSWEILKERAETYKKIRNTFRYLLASLSDFDPKKDAVKDLTPLDGWARAELSKLVREVTAEYEKCGFHRAFHKLYDFCVVKMSAIYFDILKDRLYTLAPTDPRRRSAQTVLHEILQALVRLYAPILVHTTEEVWSYMTGDREESVHLALWPETVEAEADPRWEQIWKMRDAAYVEIEKLRASKTLKKMQEARVALGVTDPGLKSALDWIGEELAEVLIVSEVSVSDTAPEGATESPDLPGFFVKAEKSPHGKCARCWNLRETVGKNTDHPEICGRCVKVVGA